jgi:transcriptional regulator with XRE-family HTH domain
MRPTSRMKSETSEKICALRALLGDSQQAFSNRLGLAINTIARYETSREPTGEVLLKFADVAEQHGHWQLCDYFRTRYVDEVFKNLGSRLITIPKTKNDPARGYLILRLNSEHALHGAQNFLVLLSGLDSSDPEIRKHTINTFSALRKAAQKYAPPIVSEIQSAFASVMKGQPQPTTKKGRENRNK